MSRAFVLESPRCTLNCVIEELGRDLVVTISGGEAPHVGCCILAVPRPSLTGHGMSATISTLNRTGHKDDLFAGDVAAALAARCDCVVACCCGIHIEEGEAADIEGILALKEPLIEMILESREDG